MILAVRDLAKNFGGIRALGGVDLDVAPGELVGLIGPNGSGKTTVFNVVTGIYRPDRGSVVLEGKDITGIPAHEVGRLGVARTFQNIRLFRELSVIDNVRAARHLHAGYGPAAALLRGERYREGERAITERAMELLSLFSLQDRRGTPAKNLPYGDQRRLEIARALASDPKILLLDEPAAGMNPAEVDRLRTFLLGIRERFRLAILLIEHQMRLVMGVCDRVAVMDFGEVIARGTPAAVRNDPRVIEAYLGDESAGRKQGEG